MEKAEKENYEKYSLDEIEDKLGALVASDKKSWVEIYRILDATERFAIWAGTYRSFTQWLKAFAEKNGVHESLLWKRKKAGSFYARYEDRRRAEGKSVVAMKDVSVSPDNFEIIERIAQGNEEIEDELVEKTLRGDMGRSDLKAAWAHVKEQKGTTLRSNAYTPFSQPDIQTRPEDVLTAAAIVTFIQSNNEWIKRPSVGQEDHIDKYRRGKYRESRFKKPIYKCLPEFPAETGTSRHNRRIDMIVLENISTGDYSEIRLRGIEIKVSKSDLINDHKMTEYKSFCDYLYFCVPEELFKEAEDTTPESVGILVAESGSGGIERIRVTREARYERGAFRDQSLAFAIIGMSEVTR